MKIKHFKDTDTALLEFSTNEIEETKEINENVYIDLDAEGDLVSITIEHAKSRASLPDVVVEQFDQGVFAVAPVLCRQSPLIPGFCV